MSRPQNRRFPPVTLLPLALLATACSAGPADYPSLSPRPIEQMSLAEPDQPPSPPPTADPEATARFAPLVEQAKTADEDFQHTMEAERGALIKGRGASEGSEAWTAAQLSLTRISAARAPVAKVLAELDAARDGGNTQTNSGEAIAAIQAFEQVQQIDTRERAALEGVWPQAQ